MFVAAGSPGNYREQRTDVSYDNDPVGNYLGQNRTKTSSRAIQEVASSAIIDSLAAEWWSSNLSQTVINDLLENLIPLVVLACEKVVNEADERQLIETASPDRSFNPVNRLASFLMRSNPKYIHFSSLSPYHYSMKSLLDVKKTQVLKVYGEEETLLRQVLKERQNERNQQRETINNEEERRKTSLKTLFHDWNVPERGWIQTKLINNMVEQFNETDLQSKLPAFQSHRMHLGTFTESFLSGLKDQSSEKFDSTIDIYRRCAQTYTNIVRENELSQLFQRLFNQLDDKQNGYLLRQNVLQTLQTFYNALKDEDKENVNQPNQWPVVKQTTITENAPDHTSPEPEKVEPQIPSASPVTNDSQSAATISENEVERVDAEPELNEDEPKDPHIELKHPSAYEANYRYSKEQNSVYNLEHFDTNDQEKSVPYDEQLLDRMQFSSLLKSFSGQQQNEMIVSALVDYFRSNYQESSEEKNDKKTLLQQRQTDAQKRAQSDALFEKINTTCTGIIKLELLANFLKQYKEGTVTEQIEQVLQAYQDHPQLTSTQFFDLLVTTHQTLNEALDGSEKFDGLLKYIDSQQPPFNPADRTRIHTRHQWLKRLRNIPFRNLGHLYKEVMDIIQKDSETFSALSSKYLSIYIALLENNQTQFRYVATTNDQTELLLGKTLQHGQGISFQVLDSGKWAYVNQTKNHSRIHFFNPEAKTHSGSFVLIPLKRLQRKSSNGLLGIDTLRDQKDKAFVQNEVQFYEGIASALADTFTFIDFDKNMIKILHRFTYWIKQKFPQVRAVDYYTYESTSMNNPKERSLKQVLTYSAGNLTIFETPIASSSRDQVFKYYVEQAALTCQSTVTSFLGQTHMIQALRGRDNYCFALIDTSIDEREDFSSAQKQELISMYRCVYMAVDELEQELINDTTKQVFPYEKKSAELRLTYLFDRIWYTDVCQRMQELSKEKLQEFINQKSKWSEQIKQTLATVSRIVKKKDMNPSDYVDVLFPGMIEFDPTTKENDQSDLWARAEQSIKAMDPSTWQQTSTDVIKLIYDWLSLALELSNIQ